MMNQSCNSKLDIIFEDEDVLVLNKAEGLIVHSSLDKKRENLFDIVKEQYKDNNISLMHRLDKDTTGAILFTKNSKVNAVIENQIQKKECEKFYLALVSGIWNEEGLIKDYLKKEKVLGIEKMSKVHSGGQVAMSYIRTIKTLSQETLMEFQLHTGRMHQIRIQAASRGHPLIGDELYGKKDPRGIFLHAYKLAFSIHGKRIEVFAPLPKKFLNLGINFEIK